MNAPFRPHSDQSPQRPEIAPRPSHDARLLTNGGPTATIMLEDTVYILHITRQGKLILTK